MAHLVDTMGNVDATPWHRQGIRLPDDLPIEDCADGQVDAPKAWKSTPCSDDPPPDRS